MADFDAPQNQQGEINIELDEETAEGTYANLVMIAHSPEEFVLDFIRMMPGVQKAKVKHRIVVTPQHAKRLLTALQDNIEKYEAAHGSIEAPNGGGTPPMNFGGVGGEA